MLVDWGGQEQTGLRARTEQEPPARPGQPALQGSTQAPATQASVGEQSWSAWHSWPVLHPATTTSTSRDLGQYRCYIKVPPMLT